MLCHANPTLQNYLVKTSHESLQGHLDYWPLFEAAIAFGAVNKGSENALISEIFGDLEAHNPNVDYVLKALEFISRRKRNLLMNEESHIKLITKLLALTDISGSDVSARANGLRKLLEAPDQVAGGVALGTSPVVHIIQENLGTAGPSSLA